MQEKWWRKGNPNNQDQHNLTNEIALTIESIREKWEVLCVIDTGLTVYKTPAGVFLTEEDEFGVLVRLERID